MKDTSFFNTETVFYICFLGIIVVLFVCGDLPLEEPPK